jgi:hypothetical protein
LIKKYFYGYIIVAADLPLRPLALGLFSLIGLKYFDRAPKK